MAMTCTRKVVEVYENLLVGRIKPYATFNVLLSFILSLTPDNDFIVYMCTQLLCIIILVF